MRDRRCDPEGGRVHEAGRALAKSIPHKNGTAGPTSGALPPVNVLGDGGSDAPQRQGLPGVRATAGHPGLSHPDGPGWAQLPRYLLGQAGRAGEVEPATGGPPEDLPPTNASHTRLTNSVGGLRSWPSLLHD